MLTSTAQTYDYESGDVITLKLTSGEEIIATFESLDIDSGSFTINHARTLIPMHNGMGLAIWPASSAEDAQIAIHSKFVIVDTPTDDSSAQAYHQSISNIDLTASSDSIIK